MHAFAVVLKYLTTLHVRSFHVFICAYVRAISHSDLRGLSYDMVIRTLFFRLAGLGKSCLVCAHVIFFLLFACPSDRFFCV